MRIATCVLLALASTCFTCDVHCADAEPDVAKQNGDVPGHVLVDAPDFVHLGELEKNSGDVSSNETNDFDHGEDGHEPVVRHKRTFGDIVLRGLADVLGYQVQRKPATPFPPPVAPLPLAGAPAPAPPPPPPPPSPPPPAPCGQPRAAPPPCAAPARAPPPPPPPPPMPCGKPRAAPLPPPPPPPPPPCGQPLAAPPPCAAAVAAPPSELPAADTNPKETITSNFQLNFNWNRNNGARIQAGPVNAPDAAPGVSPAAEAAVPAQDATAAAPTPPAPIQLPPPSVAELQPPPRRLAPARRPLPPRVRTPKVYVNAFVDRGSGVTQRINTADADEYNPRRSDEDAQQNTYDEYGTTEDTTESDYEQPQPRHARPSSSDYRDYDEEEVQESKSEPKQSNRQRTQRLSSNIGDATRPFWVGSPDAIRAKHADRGSQSTRGNNNHEADYADVHFGNRNLVNRLQNTPSRHRVDHDSYDSDDDEDNRSSSGSRRYNNNNYDSNSLDDTERESAEKTTSTEDPTRTLVPRILPPTENNPNNIDTVTVRVPPIYRAKKPRRLHQEGDQSRAVEYRKQIDDSERRPRRFRKTRSANEEKKFSYEAEDDSDYYGIQSDAEAYAVAPASYSTATVDPDYARMENTPREKDSYEADDKERTDKLGPSAKVVESEYQNNYHRGRIRFKSIPTN